MTLVERYWCGDGEHVALSLVPCTVKTSCPQVAHDACAVGISVMPSAEEPPRRESESRVNAAVTADRVLAFGDFAEVDDGL
jgi:hypothetical protein